MAGEGKKKKLSDEEKRKRLERMEAESVTDADKGEMRFDPEMKIQQGEQPLSPAQTFVRQYGEDLLMGLPSEVYSYGQLAKHGNIPGKDWSESVDLYDMAYEAELERAGEHNPKAAKYGSMLSYLSPGGLASAVGKGLSKAGLKAAAKPARARAAQEAQEQALREAKKQAAKQEELLALRKQRAAAGDTVPHAGLEGELKAAGEGVKAEKAKVKQMAEETAQSRAELPPTLSEQFPLASKVPGLGTALRAPGALGKAAMRAEDALWPLLSSPGRYGRYARSLGTTEEVMRFLRSHMDDEELQRELADAEKAGDLEALIQHVSKGKAKSGDQP